MIEVLKVSEEVKYFTSLKSSRLGKAIIRTKPFHSISVES